MDERTLPHLRVAIIHYWLTGMRGREKVVEALCRIFPQADIYTHVVRPEALSETITSHPIHTTFIQKLPGSVRHYQKYLPLMPLALEQLDLRGKGRQAVRAYSGGMKRRLHLATALMDTPALLLLDEPTVGADQHSARLILDMLRHLRGLGCGIVLISHQAGELESVCDRILTLENGLPASQEGGPWED